jgi:hypothetical protein
MCGVMLKSLGFWLFVVNTIIKFLNVAIDGFVTALDAVMSVVNLVVDIVNDASALFGGKKLINFQFDLVRWITMNTVSSNELKEVLVSLPATCVRFDSVSEIFVWSTKLLFNKSICPLVRYIYPVEWLYTPISTITAPWMYYGSAEPVLFRPDTNCALGHKDNPYEYACVGLAVGIIILGLWITVCIVYIYGWSLGPGIHKFASLFVFFLIETFEAATEIVSVTFHTILI